MSPQTSRPSRIRALALAALAVLSIADAASARDGRSCRVTRRDYASLTTGMALPRVEARLGCKGRRVTRLRVGKQVRQTFTWPARGTYGANVTLTFANGRLTDKSQLGLP